MWSSSSIFFYCFDWHVPLAQLSPTGTFNSHAPEWYVNFKQIPEIATRSKLSVILVAIVEHFFLELFYFWVLARFPPTTHNIHFSYDFAPLKFHKLAKQVRCAFSHAPSSGNWAAFCATTYHRMISTCAAAGRQGMKFLCFFKSRKSGFMCTRWNAHLFFGVNETRDCCVLQLDYVVCFFVCDKMLV